MSRRAVVTGIGMVSPLGVGKEAFSQRLFSGASGISTLSSFDTSRFTSKLAAEVRDFTPKDFISRQNLRKMDRLSRMAAASARLALEDAGLTLNTANRDRVGIVLGVAYGSTDVSVEFARSLFTDGPATVYPILVPNTVMNAPAGHTSIELGFRGVNATVNHKEASAETAIAYATAEIRRGAADVMLAGGTDIISEFFFEVLTHFKALSPVDEGPEGARPFDVSRNGAVIGEGAGVICIEAEDHARERGAVPYCEVVGWGMGAAPAPLHDWPLDSRGPLLALSRALKSARLAPHQIDVVFASANGGMKLDLLEAETLLHFFGPNAAQPLVTSIKGATGESSTSGGMRAAALAISIKENIIPPTLGLVNPIGPLGFVVGQKKESSIRSGLLNGFSSGGTYVSVIFVKPDPTDP